MTEATLLAKLTVANIHAEEMRRVFSHYGEGLISESAEESIHVYQSLDAPNEFWIYEYYPNERVAASHKESIAVAELRDAMKKLRDAPTEVHNLCPIFQYSPTP